MLLKSLEATQIQIVIIVAAVLVAGTLLAPTQSHQELIETASPQQQQQQPMYSYSLPPVSEEGAASGKQEDGPNRDEDEPFGQAELDFKMMNVAHDRLQAVRTLLNATRQQMISSSNPQTNTPDEQQQQLEARASSGKFG